MASDDQGSKYDATGNLKNWWTDQDRAHVRGARGLQSSISSIRLRLAGESGEVLHHTGKLVTGEAMGDLGGATLAYKAYTASLNGKEPPWIDGLRAISASSWLTRGCGPQISAPSDGRQLATDPHPLAKYRTNATLQNMPDSTEPSCASWAIRWYVRQSNSAAVVKVIVVR